MPVGLFTVHCYFIGRINANIYIVIQAAKVNGRGYNLSNLTCITYQTFPRQRIFEVDFCFIFRSEGFQIGTFHRLINLVHPTKSQDFNYISSTYNHQFTIIYRNIHNHSKVMNSAFQIIITDYCIY